ncbi:hypothetical protein ATANTOWER_026748 [Ataeniobius toweri]|uniref:Uncharacterized protein n=1 Tax=Ataeniobius toweri TaxID=208326 RepID=A0ABU7CCS6_9TELE|nr:hypothetical protein [Ataeniobius toweri]
MNEADPQSTPRHPSASFLETGKLLLLKLKSLFPFMAPIGKRVGEGKEGGGELLSQPRPDGLTEIICPKNGSERVDVALVYPPTPTATSPKDTSSHTFSAVHHHHQRSWLSKHRGTHSTFRCVGQMSLGVTSVQTEELFSSNTSVFCST